MGIAGMSSFAYKDLDSTEGEAESEVRLDIDCCTSMTRWSSISSCCLFRMSLPYRSLDLG